MLSPKRSVREVGGSVCPCRSNTRLVYDEIICKQLISAFRLAIQKHVCESQKVSAADTAWVADAFLRDLESLHGTHGESLSVSQVSSQARQWNQRSAGQHSCFASLSCELCGGTPNPRFKCPEKDHSCNSCQKRGHDMKVCW